MPKDISSDKYLLQNGDLITARHGNCGRTAIFQGNQKSVFTNDLIRIKLDNQILPKYYWYFTKSLEYWEQVNNLVKGTAQPQFNANSLKEIQIPIPSLEEQQKIITKGERRQKIITHQKETIQILCQEKEELLNSL